MHRLLLCCRGLSKRMTPPHIFLNYWALLHACFASVAITQYASPLQSERARSVCFRKCAALCRLIVYLSHFFFFFFLQCLTRQQKGWKDPTTRKSWDLNPIALALPLINWDNGQVTSPSSLPTSEAMKERVGVLIVFRQCWVSKTPGGIFGWDLTPLGSLIWGEPMHQTVFFLNSRDFVAHPWQRPTRLSGNNSRSSDHLWSAHYAPGTQAKYLTYIISFNPYNNPEVVTIIIPVFQRGN